MVTLFQDSGYWGTELVADFLAPPCPSLARPRTGAWRQALSFHGATGRTGLQVLLGAGRANKGVLSLVGLHNGRSVLPGRGLGPFPMGTIVKRQ